MSSDPGRVLAIDLGDVRIGLALSDPLGITAQPLPTLRSTGTRNDLTRICAVIQAHEVRTVVVGLPLLLSGADGVRAVAARRIAERLRGRLPGTAVELWDERLTSREAERTMIAGGARRGKRKQTIDALAAVLILQAYLEARESAQ